MANLIVLIGADHLLCWNHLFRNIRFAVRGFDGSTRLDEQYYKDEAAALFKSDSRSDYDRSFLVRSQNWSPLFTKYYRDNVHAKIEMIGKWQLEKRGTHNS